LQSLFDGLRLVKLPVRFDQTVERFGSEAERFGAAFFRLITLRVSQRAPGLLGERFHRLARAAVDERRPMVVVAASGGARMQEGLLSLMQMAKTVVSVQLLAEAGLPYITVLTHPTTGGVFASFATVADIILAEPGAVMSFAGARVIEHTTREKLPPDFGSSESQLAHGQVDMVVDRRELKEKLTQCLYFLMGGGASA
jgi:acetyl-CoA carboxylase carboxyl transferase subunit beta